jgi:ATP-binding cassette subfamily F protein 3
VALARLVLQRANFLLLDEPTNHLDLASQEVLESVLDEFQGTIVLVTHDRWLVDQLATQLWLIEMEGRGLSVFKGTWAQYVETRSTQGPKSPERQSKERRSEEQRQARRSGQRARREEEARQARVSELEASIHGLEGELGQLQAEIAAVSEAGQVQRLHELGTLYAELERKLRQQLEQWAEMAA